MNPELTVVTITYNKGESNRRATESVLAQSFGNFRYLLVDDGSTDETDSILSSFNDPRLVHTRQKNSGFIGSIIKCMEKVDTPFVAIHGAGDVSLPERFERQLRYLKEHPEVGAVGCYLDWSYPDHKRHAKNCKTIVYTKPAQLLKKNILNHGDVMMRTAAYQQAGGYRPFFKFAQDRDLWLRMLQHRPIAKLGEVLYEKVVIEGSNITGDPLKTEQQSLLSQFASFLARGRADDGVDFLDRDGGRSFDGFLEGIEESTKKEIASYILASVRHSLKGAGNVPKLTTVIKVVEKYDADNVELQMLRKRLRWEQMGPVERGLRNACGRLRGGRARVGKGIKRRLRKIRGLD